MATQIIDTSVYARSSTYIGAGTIDGNCIMDGGVANHTTGNFTSTGDAVQINCGFKPRLVQIINDTDGIEWEKMIGMAAANSIKITLGGSFAGVKDTSSAIQFVDGGAGNWNVLLSATLCGTSKNICFSIEG
jgi:hypothetical protein